MPDLVEWITLRIEELQSQENMYLANANAAAGARAELSALRERILSEEAAKLQD
jgi:hypothetical protein